MADEAGCGDMKTAPFQTWKFARAESNATELEQKILLICIRFGTCKVRRLNWALDWTALYSLGKIQLYFI